MLDGISAAVRGALLALAPGGNLGMVILSEA
jgi:hypothetical protein